ncbi:hypothetical protein [Streptosporangium vulgare]|uniref:hypothetical protein n=1 Tax=Streptosporangium vulgare TaxID=46190 RepID=UPI0031E120E8
MTAQIDQLSRCLDLINHKVGVYEDIIDRGAAGHECVAPPSPENKTESKPGNETERAERS